MVIGGDNDRQRSTGAARRNGRNGRNGRAPGGAARRGLAVAAALLVLAGNASAAADMAPAASGAASDAAAAPVLMPAVTADPAPVPASAASANVAYAWAAPDARFVYGVVVVVMAASVVSLLMVRSALTVSPWSFADAMSEPTETTAAERDASGNPVVATQMRASSSRMLALMGAVVILLMFLGFGTVALFSFATTGDLPPAMDRVVHFLLAGMTLFAPYAVNRFAKLFETLAVQRAR